jgi:ribosome-associated protein
MTNEKALCIVETYFDMNLEGMNTLTLQDNHLTLAQAVKAAGLVSTGGQAKHLIREGKVLVNGLAEMRPGRKLQSGDRFCLAGGSEWTVSR